VEQGDDRVERVEVVFAGPWFDRRPAEDVDRDDVDSGLDHQRDVVVPDAFGPLLRVVVAAEQDSAALPALGSAGWLVSLHSNLLQSFCERAQSRLKINPLHRAGFPNRSWAPLGVSTVMADVEPVSRANTAKIAVMRQSDDRPKRATIFDVADEAKVSRGTVSRLLNGERYVSDSAREAIELAIARVGYVRNMAARNLASQRTRAVGLIVHEPHSVFLEDPNIGAILLGTNERLSEDDYQLVCLIIGSDRDSARVADFLRGGFVDGVIIVSAREHDPIALAISQIGLPAVTVGHPSDVPKIPFVGIDNYTAARDITSRLRDTGRRRIGMIAAGFRSAIGDGFDERLVVDFPLYSRETGVAGMKELLAREPDIDGVFAASDAIAAGAIDVLRQAGRSIPGDVGIVGFDDSEWAQRCDPLLSTVRQPADLLGRQAASILLDLVNGTRPEQTGTLLPTEIVWRDSA